jgi:transcription termination/antitermination protein NusG
VTMATENTETGKAGSEKPSGKKAWFVVHTYSGYENKAKQALEDKVRANNMTEYFGQILVPSEKVTETKSGVKRTSTRKFFPSYLFVEMELNAKTMHLVKNTPKITGFVGGATNPSPVPEEEVRRITNQIAEGTLKPTTRTSFDKGDTVRVVGTVSGMSGMNGIVEEVNAEKQRATVMISILGRSVPVEMKFDDLEKT